MQKLPFLHRVFSSLIRNARGSDFVLDKSVPISYLIRIIFSKLIMGLRGLIYLRRRGLIGRNVQLWATSKIYLNGFFNIEDNCIINALSTEGVRFGKNVSIQKRTIIECTGSLQSIGKGLVVGDNVGIGSNSFLGCAGGIFIGSETIIGNFVSFHSENHNINFPPKPIRLQGVSRKGIQVGSNCWVGAKATILDGATIGDNCVIAAGALVTAGIYASNGIYGGVPAKLIGQVPVA